MLSHFPEAAKCIQAHDDCHPSCICSSIRTLCLSALLAFPLLSFSQQGKPIDPPAGYVAVRDMNYAGTQNWRQTMDLFVPEKAPAKPLPLVVFIHGGGWEGGTKNTGGALIPLIQDGGFIGATLNYRLTHEGPHPAQIHDCKAAIRWLRAHAKVYSIDPDKIGVFGISAGGHLVSLLGTSGGVKELEGDVGGNVDQSSRVTCVVNFCGPTDFLTFADQGSNKAPEEPASAVGRLIGGKVSERPEVAKAASPVTHITADDVPFLHIHGTADNLVHYAQVQEFDKAIEASGISSTVLTGEGAPHVFFSAELMKNIRTFLDKHLLGKDGEVKEGPVAAK